MFSVEYKMSASTAKCRTEKIRFLFKPRTLKYLNSKMQQQKPFFPLGGVKWRIQNENRTSIINTNNIRPTCVQELDYWKVKALTLLGFITFKCLTIMSAVWCITYLCTNARRRSFLLTSLTLVIVDGGVKQSHWMTLAFWRLWSLCCSATSDRLSYLPTLISLDLIKTLFQVDLLQKSL